MRQRTLTQEQIIGWNQDALKDISVTLIGTNALAQFMVCTLTGIEVGAITLIDHTYATKENEIILVPSQESRVLQLEDLVKKMNPEIVVNAFRSHPHPYMCTDSSVVIDTTSSKYTIKSQQTIFNHSCEIDFLGILAGTITNKIRRSAFRLRDYERTISGRNTVENNPIQKKTQGNILIVGAGALGNYTSLCAAAEGFNITICDDDLIEETNKNRQPLFTLDESTGKSKADICVRRLREIHPQLRFRSIKQKAAENYFDETKVVEAQYDLIISCVDNAETRKYLNQICRTNRIALIDGGTTPFDGQVTTYQPDKTACIECQAPLVDNKFEKNNTNSCISNSHEPSVVYTNCVIGCAVITEAKRILSNSSPTKGQLFYSSLDDHPLGIRKTIQRCEHT